MEEQPTLLEALELVLTRHYHIPSIMMDKVLPVTRASSSAGAPVGGEDDEGEAQTDDNKTLSAVLLDLIASHPVFSMNSQEFGSVKLLDIFAHMAERVFVLENEGNAEKTFDIQSCVSTVAKILGIRGEYTPSDEDRNIMLNSFLRTRYPYGDTGEKTVSIDALLELDLEYYSEQAAGAAGATEAAKESSKNLFQALKKSLPESAGGAEEKKQD